MCHSVLSPRSFLSSCFVFAVPSTLPPSCVRPEKEFGRVFDLKTEEFGPEFHPRKSLVVRST